MPLTIGKTPLTPRFLAFPPRPHPAAGVNRTTTVEIGDAKPAQRAPSRPTPRRNRACLVSNPLAGTVRTGTSRGTSPAPSTSCGSAPRAALGQASRVSAAVRRRCPGPANMGTWRPN